MSINRNSHILKVIIGPLAAALFILFFDLTPGNRQATYMAAITIWMALWWMSEVIPLGITAILPVFLFPLFSISSTADIASSYSKDILFLFLGGFLIAFTMEKWGLHKRIAFKLLTITGSSPGKVILGFMLSSYLLSMWISNTATTLMLIAPCMAVIKQLEQSGNDKKTLDKFFVGLLLSIAYSASIGGTATIIGTPTNTIFFGFYNENFPNHEEVTFFSWFIFALPTSAFMLFLSYFFFKWKFCRIHLNIDDKIIQQTYKSLGKPRYEEVATLIVFSFAVILWLTRSDISFGNHTFEGWNHLFESKDYIKDSTVAIIFSVLLFLVPRKDFSSGLLTLQELKKVPYNILLLFGGGYAITYGFKSSGLNDFLEIQIKSFSELNPFLVVCVIVLIMIILTEFISNVAAIQLVNAVLLSIIPIINIHPLLLLIPTTMASSYAFMFPIATPPNAIIMESEKITVKQMMKTGIWLNIIGLIVIIAATYTLGDLIFNLS